MKHLVLIAAVLALGAGCGKKQEPAPPPSTNAASGNPLTAPVDYLGAINNAQKRSVATVDLVQVTRAIQVFQQEEERLPKDLQELVTTGYLPRLPATPHNTRYDYNPQTGQVKVVPK